MRVGVIGESTGEGVAVALVAVNVGVSLLYTRYGVCVIGLGRNMDSSGGLKAYLILVITLSKRQDNLV